MSKDEKRTTGLTSSRYAIPKWVKDVDDLAEYLELDGFLFNVLKSMFGINKPRHHGTDEERDSEKIAHYGIKTLLKKHRKNTDDPDYSIADTLFVIYDKLDETEKKKFKKKLQTRT